MTRDKLIELIEYAPRVDLPYIAAIAIQRVIDEARATEFLSRLYDLGDYLPDELEAQCERFMS